MNIMLAPFTVPPPWEIKAQYALCQKAGREVVLLRLCHDNISTGQTEETWALGFGNRKQAFIGPIAKLCPEDQHKLADAVHPLLLFFTRQILPQPQNRARILRDARIPEHPLFQKLRAIPASVCYDIVHIWCRHSLRDPRQLGIRFLQGEYLTNFCRHTHGPAITRLIEPFCINSLQKILLLRSGDIPDKIEADGTAGPVIPSPFPSGLVVRTQLAVPIFFHGHKGLSCCCIDPCSEHVFYLIWPDTDRAKSPAPVFYAPDEGFATGKVADIATIPAQLVTWFLTAPVPAAAQSARPVCKLEDYGIGHIAMERGGPPVAENRPESWQSWLRPNHSRKPHKP